MTPCGSLPGPGLLSLDCLHPEPLYYQGRRDVPAAILLA